MQHHAFDGDRDAVVERARQAGIVQILVPGWDLASSQAALALADRDPDLLRAAVGIHPHDVTAMREPDWRELELLATDPGVVAIGEIGLDYYRNLSPPEDQREAFARQLDLAVRVGKPVIVHDRQAHDDISTALLAWATDPSAPRGPRGMLHAFSGGISMARELSNAGFLVSFALPVAFKSAAGPRAAAAVLPPGSFLVETDSPYLGPVRHGRNEPTTCLRVAAELSRLRGEAPEAVASGAGDALRRLLREPLVPGDPIPPRSGTRLAESASGPASGQGSEPEISDEGGSDRS